MIDYHNLTPEQEEEMIQSEFRALLRDYAATAHKQKVEIITKAFEFANKAHGGVKRRSGEPYIMHPLAVARIVVNEIGLGSTSICAALLHDVVEDTDYTVEDIANEFNPKIASIVAGLTKISGGIFGEGASAQAENFRKLILTIPEDVRVILIKMADRLHNMRTLGSMPPAKQLKITGETQYIYAPLAQRLGFFLIKTELENLSFKYEQPSIYAKLERQIMQVTPMLEDAFRIFIQPITKILDSYGYDYEILKRIKSPYSVFKKMQTKHITFEEVYDLLAIRIILKPKPNENEKANCWVTYSAITSIYTPHPDRTRDWINTPKSNGYEALHVTVMGPGGNWIEVQIRSQRMNDIAEKGLAAHWKYKTGEQEESDLDKWFKSIKEMLDTSDFTNAVEFMDTFKLNLYSTEIFVFTPKGDIRKMPAKATALDFAFHLHSDIGTHCIGAKVDHRLVPVSYELQSGDQIEILTSKSQKPQMEWLDFCTTGKAKAQLRTILKKELKTIIKKGQDTIEQIINSVGQPVNNQTLQVVLDHFKITDVNNLYSAIGKGKIDTSVIPSLFLNKTKNKWMRIWKLQFGSDDKKEETTSQPTQHNPKKTLHITDADVGSGYKIADCCQPIPGDNVLGFIETSGDVIVHKCDCPVAQKLQASYGNRILSAKWETQKVLSFLTTIEISGVDQTGLLKQIVQIISDDYAINIKNINIDTTDGVFRGTLDIYVYSADDITNLCKNLLKIKALKSVKRIK
ncbi:MAG: bifunctional (p)ppGpp synthetase/guanosine-3',5'-bis(diphosphate) 3'-pyrophosphohydrolase [Paludibacteraceae bacterium]|nr:bifunctional (p)ppGpp synthetase/guanosine-3',5'-bis(diphosphate) 3'-pyrophosphohydrolase [Paludibacteraceae bacterium]